MSTRESIRVNPGSFPQDIISFSPCENKATFIVQGPSIFESEATFHNCPQLEELKKQLSDIKEMINEIYYAPGMPGYYKAKESFESNYKNLNKL